LRVMLPIALIATLAPVPMIFVGTKRVNAERTEGMESRRKAALSLFLSVLPIVVILILVIAFGFSPIGAIIPVLIALYAIFRPSMTYYKAALIKIFNPSTMLMILGIMFYKETLSASGGVNALGTTFAAFGLPRLAMVLALPFAVGFLTGLTSATVVLAIPILASMYGTAFITPQIAALAYTGAVIGINLTPTHLCLVLTVNYFKVDLVKIIGMMLLPAAITLLAAALILY
jgi:integral membrane protein (TIGR00529 family)